MNKINVRTIKRERHDLRIHALDMNEFEDPLDNILRDVMFDCFYERARKKEPLLKEYH